MSVVLSILVGWAVLGTFDGDGGVVLHVLSWVVGRGLQDCLRAAAAALVACVAGGFEHVPALCR